MPVHDWSRVDAGLFHHFHQNWMVTLCSALNSGVLSGDFFALVEQRVSGPIPDVLTLELKPDDENEKPANRSTGLAVATAPPRVRHMDRIEPMIYARKANRLSVRHRHGRVVAIVEIVSPGNKSSAAEIRAFVTKAADLIQQGIHLLVIDLFPPGPRDPHGIYRAIWDEFRITDYVPPPDKPLTLAAFDAGDETVAYVEPFAVGDALIDMPIFLVPGHYVPAPLEATYQATWNVFPAQLKKLLQPTPRP